MKSRREYFPLFRWPHVEFIGGSDDVATMTVRNLGPGTVYFHQSSRLVSPQNATGSISAGNQVTVTPGMFFTTLGGDATVEATFSLDLGTTPVPVDDNPTPSRPPPKDITDLEELNARLQRSDDQYILFLLSRQ